MKVKIKSVSGVLPAYETEGAAGMDIRAFLDKPVLIDPGCWQLIPTGLFVEIPPGYEAQIRARSGLSVNRGLTLINGVGTIDSDYRGEIKVPLLNLGAEVFEVKNGDRIAQMVVATYERVNWVPEDKLTQTKRNEGGFGHTGVESKGNRGGKR